MTFICHIYKLCIVKNSQIGVQLYDHNNPPEKISTPLKKDQSPKSSTDSWNECLIVDDTPTK